MMLSTLSFWSCKDDDNTGGDGSDRLPRPMFICDNNTNKGGDWTYNCKIIDENSADLYWYTVNGAAAYEIKWAVQNYVANGEKAWQEAERNENKKSLSGDVVIANPEEFHTVLAHLQYQTDFRFAIRALNSFDPAGYELYQGTSGVYDVLNKSKGAWGDDMKNSLWYGYGNGREWADYLGMTTAKRYANPTIGTIESRSENSVRLKINRVIDYSQYTSSQQQEIKENFHFLDDAKTTIKVDYLTFTASVSSPKATENPKFVKYVITEEDWNRGYIEIDGLTKNSFYDFTFWDDDFPYAANAWVDANNVQTAGPVLMSRLIKHVPSMTDTIKTDDGTYIADISKYNSMKLDPIFESYNTDIELTENQVFELEGGKAYHFTKSLDLYKGFTLRTRPSDLAQGKKAILYMGGLQMQGNAPATCNFMLGRQPSASELSSVKLSIDSIRFQNLDVQCPLALNYGHQQEGVGSASGNYFMNMYSNGMGFTLNYLEWKGCSFQGLIRGFFRVQGNNEFFIEEMKLIDCDFYNVGYYSNSAGDYAYIFADMNTQDYKFKCNILKDVEVTGCVFNNCPKRSVITDNNRNQQWHSSVRWNINMHHNTFVNFCTIAKNPVLNTRYIPGGSTIELSNNVFITTKDPMDSKRKTDMSGWYTDKVQGGDGSARATFIVYNNWTVKGGKWNSYGMEATGSNCLKKLWNNFKDKNNTYLPKGEAELPLHVSTLTATELMRSPNPKYFIGAAPSHNDFHTDDGIEGLYYNQTDAVKNSDIYKSGAGAKRLLNGN